MQFKNIISKLIIFVAIIFSSTYVAITVYGLTDRIQKSDVAIILGSKVNTDGTLSPRLIARLDKGVKLYQNKMTNRFILSGGVGKEKVDEAAAMKTYLVSKKIPPSDIIMDNQGYNTEATAHNSLKIMREHGYKSAIIVSQYFHLARSHLAFNHLGLPDVSRAHANYFELRDLYATSREVVAFYYYLVHYGY